jgi:hypothetical protein
MHLTISFVGIQISYFLDLQIKSYGCLKFFGEVWEGRACAGANQQELTTCAKICRHEEENILEFRTPGQERQTIAGPLPATTVSVIV